ncbi:hypothetical protein [Kocuria sp. SL71]|uniref:hypothetical protein n=1 Tax=Kocuria sp. SL71 TaxID=2995151 RepID=UPI002276F36E|nr:hypothetical protein [Kocuria sp. SL71]MCY1684009.1 hypothetical protein [Kocuria sp. SL71]
MDPMLMQLHQRQIKHQCQAALIGIDVANQGMHESDQDIFWAGIQGFLTATANVSKTLWGTEGRKFVVSRQPLREALGVSDDSPLASRDLRNHLDHFDERLDEWYATSESHNFVDFYIGPPGSLGLDLDPRDMFRQFDQTENIITFWGENHPIGPIVAALQDLLPRASAATDQWLY